MSRTVPGGDNTAYWEGGGSNTFSDPYLISFGSLNTPYDPSDHKNKYVIEGNYFKIGNSADINGVAAIPYNNCINPDDNENPCIVQDSVPAKNPSGISFYNGYIGIASMDRQLLSPVVFKPNTKYKCEWTDDNYPTREENNYTFQTVDPSPYNKKFCTFKRITPSNIQQNKPTYAKETRNWTNAFTDGKTFTPHFNVYLRYGITDVSSNSDYNDYFFYPTDISFNAGNTINIEDLSKTYLGGSSNNKDPAPNIDNSKLKYNTGGYNDIIKVWQYSFINNGNPDPTVPYKQDDVNFTLINDGYWKEVANKIGNSFTVDKPSYLRIGLLANTPYPTGPKLKSTLNDSWYYSKRIIQPGGSHYCDFATDGYDKNPKPGYEDYFICQTVPVTDIIWGNAVAGNAVVATFPPESTESPLSYEIGLTWKFGAMEGGTFRLPFDAYIRYGYKKGTRDSPKGPIKGEEDSWHYPMGIHKSGESITCNYRTFMGDNTEEPVKELDHKYYSCEYAPVKIEWGRVEDLREPPKQNLIWNHLAKENETKTVTSNSYLRYGYKKGTRNYGDYDPTNPTAEKIEPNEKDGWYYKTSIIQKGTQITCDINTIDRPNNRVPVPGLDPKYYSCEVAEVPNDWSKSKNETPSPTLLGYLKRALFAESFVSGSKEGMTSQNPNWEHVWKPIAKFGDAPFTVPVDSYVRYGYQAGDMHYKDYQAGNYPSPTEAGEKSSWHYTDEIYKKGTQHYCNNSSFPGIFPAPPGVDTKYYSCQYFPVPIDSPKATLSAEQKRISGLFDSLWKPYSDRDAQDASISKNAREFAEAAFNREIGDLAVRAGEDQKTIDNENRAEQITDTLGIIEAQLGEGYNKMNGDLFASFKDKLTASYNDGASSLNAAFINLTNTIERKLLHARTSTHEQYMRVVDENQNIGDELQKRTDTAVKENRLSDDGLLMNDTLKTYNYYLYLFYYFLVIVFSMVFFIYPGDVVDSMLRWKYYYKIVFVVLLLIFPYIAPIVENKIYNSYEYFISLISGEIKEPTTDFAQ